METQQQAKALVTLSGGYDSAAALLWSLERYPTVALFVSYGQRYFEQEIEAVKYLIEECDAISEHPNLLGMEVVDVELALMPAGNRWIPYRNLVIASIATNHAATYPDCKKIIYGSKSLNYRSEDPVSFLDSTLDFYKALEKLVHEMTEPHNQPSPEFILPLVGWDKRMVLQYLHERRVNLRKIWNCYREDNKQEPCGECEHCKITQPLIDTVQGNAAIFQPGRRK